MQIIGFNLIKILVERKERPKQKIEVKQNINIDGISKDKINISKEEILKIEFTFNVDYNPDFAKLELKGHVIILPEKEELKKIIKEWKNKKLQEEFRIPLFNFIMSKCNIKALNFEDELGLPLHIPMPRLGPKRE